MTLVARASSAWLAMIIAGLALGAFVFVAWPEGEAPRKAEATVVAKADPVRRTASLVAQPEVQLAGVAGAVYSWELFDYELSPAPLLDAVIGAPEPVDAS